MDIHWWSQSTPSNGCFRNSIDFITSWCSNTLGSLNLSNIVESQQHFWWITFVPIGAIVFFITIFAELERVPFDLPEAESEIVAGWLTEFSGMMYGLIQLGTYLKLYAFAGLFVVLFLGGWNGPMVWPPFPQDIITQGITIGPGNCQIPWITSLC